jgi:hypothetical protein
MPTFTAHRPSSDNTLFPDRIEVDAMNVTYYKGYYFWLSIYISSLRKYRERVY